MSDCTAWAFAVWPSRAHPEFAAGWAATGFGADGALPWLAARFTAPQAAAWEAAGFASPRSARPWTNAGFADADDARQWRDAVRTLKAARRWRDAGYAAAEAGRLSTLPAGHPERPADDHLDVLAALRR